MSNTITSTANTSTQTVYEQLGLKDKEIYTGREKETREIAKELDKDAFLQLMMAKLQNQDPLAPTDDTQFLAQLAQFTTLEQMTNMASATEMSQGFSMVGKYVAVKMGEEEIIAKVDSVISDGGSIQLNIGGYLYTIDDVLEVFDPSVLVTDPEKGESADGSGDKNEEGVEAVTPSEDANAKLSQDISGAAGVYESMTVN